jgi:hypothetical protein
LIKAAFTYPALFWRSVIIKTIFKARLFMSQFAPRRKPPSSGGLNSSRSSARRALHSSHAGLRGGKKEQRARHSYLDFLFGYAAGLMCIVGATIKILPHPRSDNINPDLMITSSIAKHSTSPGKVPQTLPRYIKATAYQRELADKFIHATTLWTQVQSALGNPVPDSMNPAYVGRVAEMESNFGLKTVGKSYDGLFGFARDLSAETSHLNQFMKPILKSLNAAKSEIPVLGAFNRVTKETLLRDEVWNDPTVQVFILLTSSLEGHKQMTSIPEFKNVLPMLQMPLHYYQHILPKVTRGMIKELKSDVFLSDLFSTNQRMLDYMKSNPRVYPNNGAITPHAALINFLVVTGEKAQLMNARMSAMSARPRAQSKTIPAALRK